MAGRKATIVSFAKEQGFGKVTVEGETGELAFDAVVVASELLVSDRIPPGTQVMVETGPSRIPGRIKVTKLWIGDAPPG